jgi:hypothetical protein
VYIPGLPHNLFSITKALARGWQIGNTGVHINLQKGSNKIVFDTIDPTSYSCIMTVKMVPVYIENNQQHKMFDLRHRRPGPLTLHHQDPKMYDLKHSKIVRPKVKVLLN